MAGEVTTLDLRALDLAPGAVERRRVRVPPTDLRLGGQDYVTVPAAPELDLEVSRSLSGLHLRLRADVALAAILCAPEAFRRMAGIILFSLSRGRSVVMVFS